MANITYRVNSNPAIPGTSIVKGAPLTNVEVDANFRAIDIEVDQLNSSAVRLTGNQTLTDKIIAFGSNTLTDVASTNTAQTLTNKTIAFGSNTLTDVASTNTAQTLTNKTIAFGSNTLTDVASTNTAQTLTNKTIAFGSNTLTGVQPTLVSGTNIKTINGQSVLGSGDVVIGGFSKGEALFFSGF